MLSWSQNHSAFWNCCFLRSDEDFAIEDTEVCHAQWIWWQSSPHHVWLVVDHCRFWCWRAVKVFQFAVVLLVSRLTDVLPVRKLQFGPSIQDLWVVLFFNCMLCALQRTEKSNLLPSTISTFDTNMLLYPLDSFSICMHSFNCNQTRITYTIVRQDWITSWV